MTDPVFDDEWTEAVNASIDRVDLVGKAANGVEGFLLMKQDGLIDPETVRELIKQADPAPEPRDDITLTASPAALMKMVHEAAQRATLTALDGHVLAERIAKADKSTASMNDAPDSDFAYIESGGKKDDSGKTVPRSLRHFYIGDAAHVRNALARASQSPFGDNAMPKIRAAAKKFGIDVSKETSDMTTIVAKADVVPDASDVIATGGGTAESLPGSADWETMDADTAQTAIGLLGRVKAVLEWLCDREATEAVTTDPSDAEHVMDLGDASCAVDAALDTLAGFAVGEQLEAEMVEDVAMIGKAAATLDTAALSVLEGLGPIVKAGRVLSAANEAAIRGAVDSLTNVLNTLPAPIPDAAPVAKEVNPVTEPEPTPEPEEPAAVNKAKGDPLTPVYDENGKLCGMVDAADLIPIATAPAASDSAPASTDDGAPADANDGPQAGTELAAPAAPMTPAAPVADMQKSEEIELLKSELAALKASVTPMEERLAKMEAQPMPGGPMLNGAIPGADPTVTRGQNDLSSEDLFAKAIAEISAETNPVKREQMRMDLAVLGVKAAHGR